MVLFENDYNMHKSIHFHTQTKNESFLKIASLYKEMGIKNWKFPLVIYQKELIDIDPFAKDLSNDIIVKIALEAKFNPWYAFREIIRLPVQGSHIPVKFHANRSNIALFWCFFNHIDFLMIQPRQTFKSGSIDSLMIYLLFIAAENLNINLVTKDGSLRSDNIERIKSIRDLLPPYFYQDTGEDVNNKLSVTNFGLNNRYKTSVSQKSLVGANKVGRGATAPVFHLDEFSFIAHLAVTLPAALSAGTEARNQAKRNHGYYGNIFSTTAGDRADRDGEYAYRIMDSGSLWTEKYYDCKDRLEFIEMIKKNRNIDSEFKDSLLINGTFSYRQLGRDKRWLDEAIANSRGDAEQKQRDFLNKWTTGSTYSPLSSRINDVIFNSEKEENFNEVTEAKYILRWHCDEENRRPYLNSRHFILGIDTSEAVGRDAIGVVLSDINDLRTVMVTNITEANLYSFAHWLASFLIRYPNITLIPEMKSSARVIIDVLIIELTAAGICPFTRIFNGLINDPSKYPQTKEDLNKSVARRNKGFNDKYRKEFGFVTTADSREMLFRNNLQLAASRAGHLVFDKILSKEIRGLVVKKGRIDHKASGHDDVCVAWLLNHWFLTHARNLERYGIRRGEALSMVKEDDESINISDSVEIEKQIKLREKIDKIVESLSNADNPILIAKLSNDLKRLTLEVSNKDTAIYNYDDLIKRANELKIKRIRLDKERNNYFQKRRFF